MRVTNNVPLLLLLFGILFWTECATPESWSMAQSTDTADRGNVPAEDDPVACVLSTSSSSGTSSSSSSGENGDNTTTVESPPLSAFNAAGISFTNYFKLFISLLRVVVSIFNLVYVIKLRNEPPFSSLHIPLIVAADIVYLLMGVSRMFTGFALLEIYSDAPWWLQLDQLCLTYGIIFYFSVYFPFCSSIILNAVHLRIDYQVAFDSVNNRSSIFYKYKPLLKGQWLYTVGSIVLMLAGSASTIVLLKQSPAKYWLVNYNDPKYYRCGGDYTSVCGEDNNVYSADLYTTVVFFVFSMIFSVFFIKGVRDAFRVRLALTVAGISVACANLSVNIFGMVSNDTVLNSWTSVILFGTCLMMCQMSFPFGTILYTLKMRKEMRRFLRKRTSSRLASDTEGTSEAIAFTGRLQKRSDLISLLEEKLGHPVMDEFQDYLVTEFCAENILFLRQSLALRNPDIAKNSRLETSKNLARLHFAPESVDEINVTFAMKKRIMETVDTDGGSPDFWLKVDDEVAGMLLDPYNRFALKRKREQQTSQSIPSKRITIKSGVTASVQPLDPGAPPTKG